MAVSAIAAIISTVGAVSAAGGLAAFTFSVGSFTFAAGITSALAFFAASTAIGAALNALAPKPEAPKSAGYSVTARGGNLDHQIVYGKTRVAGVIVAERLSGEGDTDGTRFLHRVIALAGHEIESIEEVYIDGKRVDTFIVNQTDAEIDSTGINAFNNGVSTLVPKDMVEVDENGDTIADTTSNEYVTDPSGDTTRGLFLGFYTGSTDQTVSTKIQNEMFNGDTSLWGTNHRLRGIAYMHVIAAYIPEAFRNGPPEIQVVVKGKKVYDTRSDTTVWSDNPALCLRDYLTSKYGLNEDTTRIDDTLVSTAANICDTADTWNSKQYTTNGSMLTNLQPFDAINDLLTPMGGNLWYAQGKWRMKAAAWTSPVETFDENDFREPVQIQTRHSMRDNFNTVTGSFRGESSNWAVTEFPPVSNASFVTEDDGREVTYDVPMPFTNTPEGCRKLARIILERNREQKTIQTTVGLKGFKVQVGDIVNVNFDRFSWSNKTFEVTDWTFGLADGGDLQVALTLREIQASVFDDVDDGVTFDPVNPGTGGPTLVDITPTFSQNTVTYDSQTGGANVPILVSLWSVVDEDAVDYYEWEYRLTEFDYGTDTNIVTLGGTPTAREQAVFDAYVAKLGRVPDQSGFDFYVTGGGSGLTIDAVESQLAASSEAQNQTPFSSIRVNKARYELRGIKEDDAYDIRLRAVGTNGLKSKYIGAHVQVNVDTLAPKAPTNVISSPETFNAITVRWTNPTLNTDNTTLNDFSRIDVYAETGDTTPDQLIGSVSGQNDNFVHTGLSGGETWYYRLKAVDYAGNTSAYSNVDSATVRADPRLERSAGVYYIGVSSLPTTSTQARNAWNNEALSIDPSVPTDGPVKYDQAWFYTGTLANPTAQSVFIADSVSSATSHTWNEQEVVIDGDLLVSQTVTANKIVIGDSSLTADGSGNLIVQGGNITVLEDNFYSNTPLGGKGWSSTPVSGDLILVGGNAVRVPAGFTADLQIVVSFQHGYYDLTNDNSWGLRVTGGGSAFGGTSELYKRYDNPMSLETDYATVAVVEKDIVNTSGSDEFYNVFIYWNAAWSATVLNENELLAGTYYEIVDLGSTNWNTLAGTSGVGYSVGDIFECVNTSATDNGGNARKARVELQRCLTSVFMRFK